MKKLNLSLFAACLVFQLSGTVHAAENSECKAQSDRRIDALLKPNETIQNGSDPAKKDKSKAASAASQPSG